MGLRILSALFLGLSFSVARAEAVWQNDPQAPEFCLQNFNAYGPIYASGVTERTERWTADLQAKPACEVVHLQEVWNESHINQVESALRGKYEMSEPNRKARIGLMSLFKGRIRQEQTYSFKVNNEGGVLDGVREMFNVKKAFHIVTADVPSLSEDVYFVNTHLHPSSQTVRLTQILDILNWRLQNQDRKMILSGDFNASFNTFEHEFVKAVLQVQDSLESVLGSYNANVCTYCHKNPLSWLGDDRVFDYIFLSNVGESSKLLLVKDGRINMRGTEKRPFSDHFGLRIQFAAQESAGFVDALAVEMDAQSTIQTLLHASELLKSEKNAGFAPYKSELAALIQQLRSKQGPFVEYLVKSSKK